MATEQNKIWKVKFQPEEIHILEVEDDDDKTKTDSIAQIKCPITFFV